MVCAGERIAVAAQNTERMRAIFVRLSGYTLKRIENGAAVFVEEWLATIQRSRGTKAKIRNIMSAVSSHAIRYGWMKTNPIRAVRQSAKRERIPTPLTAGELHFGGTTTGSLPWATPIQATDGDLYGGTSIGGADIEPPREPIALGARHVFSLLESRLGLQTAWRSGKDSNPRYRFAALSLDISVGYR